MLVKSKSKPLRALLYQKIISDIRAANAKTTNHPLNRTAQNILYSLVTSDRSSRQAIWAVRIARELWRRRIWSDSKTVEIVKEACLADHEKVATAAVRFFLTGDKDREEAPDDDMSDDDVDFGRIRHQIDLNKKSKRREHELKRATASVKRVCGNRC